jgi:hypothetical protein
MVLFLIWLAVFLLAIGVLTNVLVATAINEDIQGRLAPMSDSKFRRTFVAWSIIMVLVGIGWVIWMSWPPSVQNVMTFLSSPILVLPWVLPAAVYGASIVPFWKESKRRKRTRGSTDP